MKYKNIIGLCIVGLCLLASGSGAEEQTKRVMSYIAVMDFKCGKAIESDVCQSLADVAISELVKIGKYTVIDRANRDKILSEQGFQQAGCVENMCTVEAGRLLGVGKIVTGSITKIGQTYLVNFQLINVQTASVETTADEECKCEPDGLIQAVRNASRKLMGEQPQQTSPAQPAAQPEEKKAVPITIDTSKIADSGLFSLYQQDKAMVVFYRPDDGFWSSPKLYDSNRLLVTIPRKKYFVYETAPGLHQLTMKATGWKTSTLNITLIAGKTIFLQIGAYTGITIAPPDQGLLEVKMYEKITH